MDFTFFGLIIFHSECISMGPCLKGFFDDQDIALDIILGTYLCPFQSRYCLILTFLTSLSIYLGNKELYAIVVMSSSNSNSRNSRLNHPDAPPVIGPGEKLCTIIVPLEVALLDNAV